MMAVACPAVGQAVERTGGHVAESRLHPDRRSALARAEAHAHVRHLIQAKGVTFDNSFVSNSLRCPGRTSILTGFYSHTTGIYYNSPPNGGFSTSTPAPTSGRTRCPSGSAPPDTGQP